MPGHAGAQPHGAAAVHGQHHARGGAGDLVQLRVLADARLYRAPRHPLGGPHGLPPLPGDAQARPLHATQVWLLPLPLCYFRVLPGSFRGLKLSSLIFSFSEPPTPPPAPPWTTTASWRCASSISPMQLRCDGCPSPCLTWKCGSLLSADN